MTKQDYVAQLRIKLRGIPQEEVENAIAYIEEYFEEAGVENEETVMKELGSVEKFANQIRADYTIRNINNRQSSVKQHKGDGVKNVALIVLGICSLPIALPLGLAAIILVLTMFLVVGILIFAFGLVAISLVFSAVIAIVIGFSKLAVNINDAITLIGNGCLMVGIGILITQLSIWTARTLLPSVTRLTGKLYHKMKGERYE